MSAGRPADGRSLPRTKLPCVLCRELGAGRARGSPAAPAPQGGGRGEALGSFPPLAWLRAALGRLQAGGPRTPGQLRGPHLPPGRLWVHPSVCAVAGGTPVGLPGQTSPAESPSPRQPCQLSGAWGVGGPGLLLKPAQGLQAAFLCWGPLPSPRAPGPGSLTLRRSCPSAPLCLSAAGHPRGLDSCRPGHCTQRGLRCHPSVPTAGVTPAPGGRLPGCGAPRSLSSGRLHPLPPTPWSPRASHLPSYRCLASDPGISSQS